MYPEELLLKFSLDTQTGKTEQLSHSQKSSSPPLHSKHNGFRLANCCSSLQVCETLMLRQRADPQRKLRCGLVVKWIKYQILNRFE